MSTISNKAALIYSVLLSLLSALIVSFLIKNITIMIIYSITAFLLTFSISFLLVSETSKLRIETKKIMLIERKVSRNIIYSILALFASLFILIFSTPNLIIDPTSMWNSFVSLPFASFVQVLSTFFLTSIFPGIIIYSNFIRKFNLNIVEKAGLILLLSYCFTTIISLILISFQAFSNFAFIAGLWILVGVIEVSKRLRGKDKTEVSNNNYVFYVDADLIALIIAAAVLVGLSYLQVLAVAPLNGIMSGDIPSYMVAANRFIYSSNVFGWAPYIWSSVFYWTNSSLSDIPMLYVICWTAILPNYSCFFFLFFCTHSIS